MTKNTISIKSPVDFEQTLSGIEATIKEMDLTLFSKIDHAKAAQQAGLEMQPTTLLLYGNPKAGTPLMQENILVGLELPLKTLVWMDTEGQTWMSYKDMDAIATMYELNTNPAINIIKNVLARLHQ